MDADLIPNDLDINCGRKFNMEICMGSFAEYYAEMSAGRNTEYWERNSRLMFLGYLKEYMSIYGFCYIDSKNTDICRMDVIAEISGAQYIIELRTLRGESQVEDEIYQQFADYLESKRKIKGYIAAFDFRHGADKQPTDKYIDIDGKTIYEIVV